MSSREQLRALDDERAFLSRSLADLERERAAGDLSELDYEQLLERYATRLSEAERAIDEHVLVEPSRKLAPAVRFRRFLGCRSTRRALVFAAAGSFLVGAVLLALSLSGVRLPGEQVSGSVSLPSQAQIEEDLARAAVLVNAGQLSSALALYSAVLVEVPTQPVALCYRGWLERLSGLAAKDQKVVRLGDASIAEAVRVDPSYPDARALDAVALYEDKGDVPGAVEQFERLVSDHPSAALLSAVRKEADAVFKADHLSVPDAFRPR